jgi:hypothetical protein
MSFNLADFGLDGDFAEIQAQIESTLEEMATSGVTAVRKQPPVGMYKAQLVSIGYSFGMSSKPDRDGEIKPWSFLKMSFTLTSEEARDMTGVDAPPMVYASIKALPRLANN